METFEQIWSRASEIEGWLTRAQAKRLHDTASRLRPGDTAVEIGSHKGRSAVVIAGALPEDARLFAIDPYGDARWGGGTAALDEFKRNIEAAGLGHRVEIARALSGDVSRKWPSDRRIAMLYIDGAHDYAAVSNDIRSWSPRIQPRGSLLIHDAFSSVGVTKAVLRHVANSPSFDYRAADRTLVEFTAQSASVWGRVRLYARLGYFARNVGVKIALRRRWAWLRLALGQWSAEDPY